MKLRKIEKASETYAQLFLNIWKFNFFFTIFISPKLWIRNVNLDVQLSDATRIVPRGVASGFLFLFSHRVNKTFQCSLLWIVWGIWFINKTNDN